jgi:hypothetical protein
MSIGGFNGTDPAPTLAQFEQYVSQGKIHYYIEGGKGGGGFGGGADTGAAGAAGGAAGGATGGADTSSTASQIATWVAAHYTAKTVDGVTVYDLTAPTS